MGETMRDRRRGWLVLDFLPDYRCKTGSIRVLPETDVQIAFNTMSYRLVDVMSYGLQTVFWTTGSHPLRVTPLIYILEYRYAPYAVLYDSGTIYRTGIQQYWYRKTTTEIRNEPPAPAYTFDVDATRNSEELHLPYEFACFYVAPNQPVL